MEQNFSIESNLNEVRNNIREACMRSGRDPEEVTLLAVSKTKPVEAIREAMAAGQRAFGENYVQELTEKTSELGYSLTGEDGLPVWHMIGHLQRNKVKYIIDKAALIHAVDSLHLAEQIEKEAAKHDLRANVLLEVNVAGEDTKWGFSPEETEEAAREIGSLPHVAVCGLMTSAPYTLDPESNRMHFRNLKVLSDRLSQEGIYEGRKPVLSMGMSGDYEVAVEEGATIVRVGTSIFGERDYH